MRISRGRLSREDSSLRRFSNFAHAGALDLHVSMRRHVRSLIPAWIIESARRGLEKLDPFVNLSYSQDGEDMVLRRLLEGRRQGFYVDVGAHDPCRFSNTCYFHRQGWRGINIDPNPDAIRAFDLERVSDINICVGVSDYPGELSFHFFNEPALNTFDESLAQERANLPGYRLLETRSVRVRRLDDLLGEYLPRGQRIDFLSVDVEGMDLAVLRSNDWARFRPGVLLVEAHQRTVSGTQTEPVNLFVTEVGYQLIAKTLNTLIYEDARNSNLSAANA
jgi:FkbM family methyltransferase